MKVCNVFINRIIYQTEIFLLANLAITGLFEIFSVEINWPVFDHIKLTDDVVFYK